MGAGLMTEQALTSTVDSRRRGVGFPSMILQDAVDAVVVAGQNGPEHTQDAFATYLGHRTANSGAFRAKLASLRDWGLIARGDRDRVSLSGLAQELVLLAPDHYQARRSLLAAFESCRVFGMVYGDSAKNVAMDISRLRTQVLMRHGVSSEQADKFVESFIKSAVFTGIAESDGSKVTLLPRDSVFSSDSFEEDDDLNEGLGDQVVSTPPGEVRGSAVGRSTPVVIEPPIRTALRQGWPIDGGEIEFIIRTPEALPPSIYALVAEMAAVAEKMQEKLAGPYVEITAPTPPASYLTHPATTSAAG